MDKKPRISSFIVVQSRQSDRGLQMQVLDPLTNRVREAELCVNLDNLTGEITVGAFRHYGDPESEPWFEGSEPWTADERREYEGDDE